MIFEMTYKFLKQNKYLITYYKKKNLLRTENPPSRSKKKTTKQ